MRRGVLLNQKLAAKIERLVIQTIRTHSDYLHDPQEFDKVLKRQEGVLPRAATLLGPQSSERYAKK